MSEIHCTSLEDFYNAIEELTHRGIIFKAYTAEFVIKLTGGF